MLGEKAYLWALKVVGDVAHKQGGCLPVDILHLLQDVHVVDSTTVWVEEASKEGIDEGKVWLFADREGASCHTLSFETYHTPEIVSKPYALRPEACSPGSPVT